MKSLFAILTLSLSLSAIARERVLLNSEEVVVNASEAILVRTNETPMNVKVSFLVPKKSRVCEAIDQIKQPVMVHCGTDYSIQTFQDPVCTRRNPRNKECLKWTVVLRSERIPVQRLCPQEQYVKVCYRYGTIIKNEMESMKLTFKNLPSLGDSETDTFLAKAERITIFNLVDWEMTNLQTVAPYKISKIVYDNPLKINGFEIEEK